ncbi:MAG: T9SS type A sorting domain-containing protein [Chitinispirillaceae bacterium]|nr:T9SS type A sorting domain-containing protein [Chitinispirillaceae bacterium]
MTFFQVPSVLVLLLLGTRSLFSQANFFDYKKYLFGTPATLSLSVQSINTATGSVTANGVDTRAPTTPFTWNWGDGTITGGFFPQAHTYANISRNYILRVTANYSDGAKDSTEALIRFAPSSIDPITLSPDFPVTIPGSKVDLTSRQQGYGFTNSLSCFDDSFFAVIPRATLQYVLSIIAAIEMDFANEDVFLIDGKFSQVMLRDSSTGGAYSIWYSSPVAFGVGDAFLRESIGYSSLFHEMGHNVTLNSPAKYYYGGKIDGCANAIFSETMAQIFQHAAGFQIINDYQFYGLSEDLMFDMRSSVVSSIALVRSSYERYLSDGKKFVSWNDPGTSTDESFTTFMTMVYKFCEQAEKTGQGYKTPLKKMMKLLDGFNTSWLQRYDPQHNSTAADTFRATLMVTAVSYAFGKDLRADFRNLNFPVSDKIYNELYGLVTSITGKATASPLLFELYRNYLNYFNTTTTIVFGLPHRTFVSLKIFDASGRETASLIWTELSVGTYSQQWNTEKIPCGVYFCRLQAGSFMKTRKLTVLR